MPKPFELRTLPAIDHVVKETRYLGVHTEFGYVPPGTFWAGGWPLPRVEASYQMIQRGFWLQTSALGTGSFNSGDFNSFLANNRNFRMCTDLELEYISRYGTGHKDVEFVSHRGGHILSPTKSIFFGLKLAHIVAYHKNTDFVLRYGIDWSRDDSLRISNTSKKFNFPIGFKYEQNLMTPEKAAQLDSALLVRLVWNGDE
jgi:hypothetical protein